MNTKTAKTSTGWDISEEQRKKYSKTSRDAQKVKLKSIAENKVGHYQNINKPTFDPKTLMPQKQSNDLKALSLFSGGGGLDLGFDRAGFSHVASYEILDFAAETLLLNRPDWKVFGGENGDVTKVSWKKYKDKIDVIHGGPPCQPFSTAGKQAGSLDARDMIPEFVRAVKEISPRAFVMENVPGLTSIKFKNYINNTFYNKLSKNYTIHSFKLAAASFGVPQTRKRVIFVGFKNKKIGQEYIPPIGNFDFSIFKKQLDSLFNSSGEQSCIGVRKALGLENIGYDQLAPTIKCSLTGPRSTTSIISSSAAQKKWHELGIWANGVQSSREKASAFPTKDGTFRLSVSDCALIQGFPLDWKFHGPVYKQLGQIGNSVAPPMAYAIAESLEQALSN